MADGGACMSSDNYEFYNPLDGISQKRSKHGKKVIFKESNGFYTSDDITRLEGNFLGRLDQGVHITEDDIFSAMESTLELLRKIHEEKGEVVKDYTFTKRELVNI